MRLQFPRTLLAVLVIWTSIQSSFPSAVANDDFASAIALEDNVPAYGKATPIAGGKYQSVWYKYTAPTYGICTITVDDAPEPPPPPSPYTGDLSFVLVDLGSTIVFDNGWGLFGIPIEVYVKDSPESAFYVDSGYGHLALMVGAGVTYYFRVPVSSGSRFQIRTHTASDSVSQNQYRGTFYANKNFAHPAYLHGASCKALGYGQNASAQNAIIGNHALWWCWTAPSTGTTIFTTNGTYNEWIIDANTGPSSPGVLVGYHFWDGSQPFDEFDPIVTVGTGSSWESFNYTRHNKEVFLKTVAGRTYRIAVGANHFRGTYLFSIVHWPKIPNDGSSSGTGGAFWNSNHFLPRTKMMQGSFFQPEGIDGINVHVHGKARASHISYDNLSGVFRFLSRKTAPRSRTAHVTYTITAYHGNQAVATVRKTAFLR